MYSYVQCRIGVLVWSFGIWVYTNLVESPTSCTVQTLVHETSNYRPGVIFLLAPKITDEMSPTVRKLELKALCDCRNAAV
jgi:hypothetical protein